MARSLGYLLAALGLAVTLTACPDKKPKPDPSVSAPSASGSSLATPATAPSAKLAATDAAHGKELVAKYECNRCHDGTGHPAPPQSKQCVGCHKDIMEDRFKAPAESIARWKGRVKDIADTPSLDAAGKRFTRRWIESFLLQPSDLRPHLAQYMPRLAISAADAKDIAAYLVPEADAPVAAEPPELKGADLGKGRQLVEAKGCGSCHVFTGAPIQASAPPSMDPREFDRAFKLAPDLRVTRERTTPARLLAWLEDPKAVKPDSAMPKIALTPAEAKDIAAFLWSAELAAPAPAPKTERLPVLTRKVTFKEVDEKVFHRTCWHCHSEPDYAIGDGGPGNSGGYGFRPRGLNLSDYNGIAAGWIDDKGERQSIFAKEPDGTPRIVRALLARHDEVGGAPTGAVRGMPLGYAPLPPEQIQLVETWVAQGRPR
jgi:cytochrome c2